MYTSLYKWFDSVMMMMMLKGWNIWVLINRLLGTRYTVCVCWF